MSFVWTFTTYIYQAKPLLIMKQQTKQVSDMKSHRINKYCRNRQVSQEKATDSTSYIKDIGNNKTDKRDGIDKLQNRQDRIKNRPKFTE